MLDFVEVNQQIAAMAAESRLAADDMAGRLALAVERLRLESGAWQAFVDKIAASRTSWLVADIREPLDRAYGLPARRSPARRASSFARRTFTSTTAASACRSPGKWWACAAP